MMKVLVVDDEEAICVALEAWLSKEGYHVETAGSGMDALELLSRRLFDMYLVDIKMPGMDGLDLLARIRELQPDATIIMITAHGSIQTAVEAMKRGAADYLCKPFDPEALSLLMERVAATKALRDENVVLRGQLLEQQAAIFDDFIAQSEAMHAILAQIDEVAPSNAPVLITGETGVGKDLVARAIHTRSEQAFGPFVAINCGAQTESLLESELFGHERGAFTGAVKVQRGRLEMANKGTLFLDEVGEICPRMQVSLLRALEEKRITRIGGSQPIEAHFRLISATHRDLRQLMRENRFREDFFYRINVFTMHVPSLRERREDIPVLADFFLEKYARETGKPIEGITQKGIGLLMSYPWPGNVRELRNVMERAVVLARGRMIGAEELCFVQTGAELCNLGTLTLREAEIRYLKAALETHGWNVTQAARQLGIDRVTLARKMKRHHIGKE
jgi:two-component system response regulator HydG